MEVLKSKKNEEHCDAEERINDPSEVRLGDGSRTHPRLDKGQGPPGPCLALGQINPKNRVTTSEFITYGAADLSSVTGKPSTGVVLVNVFLTLTAPGLCTDRELTACRPLCWGVTQGSAFVPDALTPPAEARRLP